MVAEPLNTEKPYPLTKAGRLFDSNPSIPTLIRWTTRGILGPDRKTRVYLRSKLIGGRRFIERAAAEEFIAALNATPRTVAPLRKGDSSRALERLGC